VRRFAGKTVVITGGAGGLGRAFARRFAAAGARPALLDLDGGAAAAAAAEVGGLGLACDVTDPAACRRAVETVAAELGGVDVLINNAGVTHRSAFAHTSAEVYRRVMEVNFFGALHCTQAALPWLLQSRGAIIAISSIAGFSPLLGRTGYAASKHALHGLFDSLRAELKPRGVHVLIVCPGFTNTGIAGAALDGDGTLTTHRQSTVGRVASPAEVAAATLRAAGRERRLLVLSTVGRLTRILTRMAPGLYERLMARSLAGELRR
jgi:NAD(P)-dependent dehydrogenase (short-subunit alcohol dehydrogenase family)